MKTRFYLSILASSFVLVAFAQQKEDRRVGAFTKVAVGYGIDVVLTQGNGHGVEVTAPSDVIDKVITEVSGGKLTIKMEKNRSWSWKSKNDDISVAITMTTLDAITASGGSDVEARGKFQGDHLDIESSGGSDIELEVQYNSLTCNSSGGSDLTLEGQAKDVRVTASGGSDVEAKQLEVTESCDITASGGSDAYITVNGDLDATASGASDVYVFGDPRSVRQNSSGASDVHIR